MSAHFRHAMPYGAQWRGDGRTRFRLWAPDAGRVLLDLDRDGTHPMRALDDGWHERIHQAPPGTRYRYRVREDLRVPDPASRLQQAGDVHGASVVVDPAGYAWRHAGWTGRPWREAVLYELHAGLCGGFRGVRALLPGLRALGVTAVELMPVAQFPGTRNWGYDGVLPFAPAAAYGAPDELKALVDAAHGQGLMVLLDVVYNHFGPDGNYLGAYASPFFRAGGRRTPWGAAIDVARPPVGDFFVHNALYWLEEFRFDGLRLDAAHALRNPAWLLSLAARVRAATAGRQVHLVLENEDGQPCLLGAGRFDAQWNDDFHHALHVLLTGETAGYYAAYADDPMVALARCLADGRAGRSEPMAGGRRGAAPGRRADAGCVAGTRGRMGAAVGQGADEDAVVRAHDEQNDAPAQARSRADARGAARVEPDAPPNPLRFVHFLQNHDQLGNRAFGERLAALADPRRLDAACALLLLTPAVPLLFMGEEWASRAPFLYFTDHRGDELRRAIRAGRRREFAAFLEGRPADALPDPDAPRTFERSRPDAHEAASPAGAARLALVRQLLAQRARHLAPRLEHARPLGARVMGARALHARWQLDDARLHVYCNLDDHAAIVHTPPTPAARWLHGEASAIAALDEGRLEPARTLVCLEASA